MASTIAPSRSLDAIRRSWKLVGKFSEKTIPEERAEEAFRCETQSKVFTMLYNIPAVKRAPLKKRPHDEDSIFLSSSQLTYAIYLQNGPSFTPRLPLPALSKPKATSEPPCAPSLPLPPVPRNHTDKTLTAQHEAWERAFFWIRDECTWPMAHLKPPARNSSLSSIQRHRSFLDSPTATSSSADSSFLDDSMASFSSSFGPLPARLSCTAGVAWGDASASLGTESMASFLASLVPPADGNSDGSGNDTTSSSSSSVNNPLISSICPPAVPGQDSCPEIHGGNQSQASSSSLLSSMLDASLISLFVAPPPPPPPASRGEGNEVKECNSQVCLAQNGSHFVVG
ncbi:hypothetical protein BT96DRAFT_989428 [Gymnopus androsaceus JB14]|uniref:Uncharacterized protein n=1 Tax=Gymnopus androsaceus JB14 TaxID=1447944 RepID=A0A6A4I0W5_9AGAR|nr:hypothetical protein BT96DRAFT_989428 [Gymnopus androsaceus JB14]